jgi:hypothetical protein
MWAGEHVQRSGHPKAKVGQRWALRGVKGRWQSGPAKAFGPNS